MDTLQTRNTLWTVLTENIDSKPLVIDYHGNKFAKLIKIDCGAGWSGRLCLWNIDTDKYFLSDYAVKLNTNSRGRGS